jgi:hypothetical protein
MGLTWAANVLYMKRLTDILTCYKVMRTPVARSLDLRCNGFDLDAEITCRLLRDGHRIVEVPVTYEPRSVDEGKKLSPGVGWSVLSAIVRTRFAGSSTSSASGHSTSNDGERELVGTSTGADDEKRAG